MIELPDQQAAALKAKAAAQGLTLAAWLTQLADEEAPASAPRSAKEAVAQVCAIPAKWPPMRPALLFIFDCGGRRGQLGDQLQTEFDEMKKASGGVKMFGFYGSGEIGPVDNNSPSRGVGYHIVACAVYPVAPAK